MPTFTPNYDLAKPLVNNPVDEDVWGGQLNDNMDKIDAALTAIAGSGSAGVPFGTISDYAGSTAPTGWLLCFGQAVSRTTYSDLFTVIGTTYGVGDGATTFNIPDCRGRVSAGKDDMGGTAANRLTGSPTGGVVGTGLGNVGGAQGHQLTSGQNGTHTHTSSLTGITGSGTLNINTVGLGSAGSNADYVATAGAGAVSSPLARGATPPGSPATTVNVGVTALSGSVTIDNSGSGDSHNNVQPTIIFNRIIKALP